MLSRIKLKYYCLSTYLIGKYTSMNILYKFEYIT